MSYEHAKENIDGKKIKEDTWYMMRDGKIVEV